MVKKKLSKKKKGPVIDKAFGWPKKMWLVMKVSKWESVTVRAMGRTFDVPTETDTVGFCRVYDDREKALAFAGWDESLVKQIETLV